MYLWLNKYGHIWIRSDHYFAKCFFVKSELNILSSVCYKGERLILKLSYTLKMLSAVCGISVEYGIQKPLSNLWKANKWRVTLIYNSMFHIFLHNYRVFYNKVIQYKCQAAYPYVSRDMTKPTKWLCAQRRLRSAWASAQSDQSLRCAPNG